MKAAYTTTILLFFITISWTGYSQSFGIKAGLSLSNISFLDEGSSLDVDIVPRFDIRLGLNCKLPILNFIDIESGLFYSKEGYVYQMNDYFDYEGETNYIINYLELPVNFHFKINLKKTSIFILTGGYVAYGVSGYIHDRGWSFGNYGETTRKIKWGKNKEDDFQRLDYGLNIGAGMEFNPYQLNLVYKMGLSNLLEYYYPYTYYPGYTIENRVFTISLGYYFPKR